MRKRAYLFAREMVWKKAAQGYMESFARVRSDRKETPRVQFSSRTRERVLSQLPPLNINHVNALTDDTGMIQHAIFTIPNRAEGYSIDDNARALIFTVLLEELKGKHQGAADALIENQSLNPDWAFRYLAFLEHAFNPKKKRFRNFLGFDRRWMEEQGLRRFPCPRLCGPWEAFWAARPITDFEEPPDDCSSTRFPPWSASTARALVRIRSWEFRSTCMRTRVTAMPSG